MLGKMCPAIRETALQHMALTLEGAQRALIQELPFWLLYKLTNLKDQQSLDFSWKLSHSVLPAFCFWYSFNVSSCRVAQTSVWKSGVWENKDLNLCRIFTVNLFFFF